MLLIAVLLCLPTAVTAHPTVEERLLHLEQADSAETCDAASLLRRGNLQAEKHDWQAALESFDRAAACDPESPEIELARAELYLAASEPETARQYLDRYLARQATPRGHVLRARARTLLGEAAGAIEDYDQALAELKQPQPDHYLERARLQVGLGRIEAARRGLDAGIARLGPVPALEQLAVDLEVQSGLFDAALARLDSLIQLMPTALRWQMRRAEVLELAGRRREAHAAYEQTLQQLQQRSLRRTNAPALQAFEAEARKATARLTASHQP